MEPVDADLRWARYPVPVRSSLRWLRALSPEGRDAFLYAASAVFAGVTAVAMSIPLYREWGRLAVCVNQEEWQDYAVEPPGGQVSCNK